MSIARTKIELIVSDAALTKGLDELSRKLRRWIHPMKQKQKQMRHKKLATQQRKLRKQQQQIEAKQQQRQYGTADARN
jgi:hypothetical protein